MSRKSWAIVAAIIVVHMIAFLAFRTRPAATATPAAAADYSRDHEDIDSSLTTRAAMSAGQTIDGIGDLVGKRYWTEVLPLSSEQKAAIGRLDRVASECRRLGWIADAGPGSGPPDGRLLVLSRHERRMEAALAHARRVVTLGILDDAQSAYVVGRTLEARGLGAMNDDNVADLLGLSGNQRDALAAIVTDHVAEYASMSTAMGKSVVPKEQKRFDAIVKDLTKSSLARFDEVLTPAQRVTWAATVAGARSLPARPAEATATTDADASRAAREASAVFRVLAEEGSTFDLSTEQAGLVKELEAVAGIGLVRVDRRPTKLDRTRRDLVAHAEGMALLGILREDQADRVREAVGRVRRP